MCTRKRKTKKPRRPQKGSQRGSSASRPAKRRPAPSKQQASLQKKPVPVPKKQSSDSRRKPAHVAAVNSDLQVQKTQKNSASSSSLSSKKTSTSSRKSWQEESDQIAAKGAQDVNAKNSPALVEKKSKSKKPKHAPKIIRQKDALLKTWTLKTEASSTSSSRDKVKLKIGKADLCKLDSPKEESKMPPAKTPATQAQTASREPSKESKERILAEKNDNKPTKEDIPDERYSMQQLHFASFVHNRAQIRTWSFADSRPLKAMMGDDELEGPNNGFDDLLAAIGKHEQHISLSRQASNTQIRKHKLRALKPKDERSIRATEALQKKLDQKLIMETKTTAKVSRKPQPVCKDKFLASCEKSSGRQVAPKHKPILIEKKTPKVPKVKPRPKKEVVAGQSPASPSETKRKKSGSGHRKTKGSAEPEPEPPAPTKKKMRSSKHDPNKANGFDLIETTTVKCSKTKSTAPKAARNVDEIIKQVDELVTNLKHLNQKKYDA